MFSLVKFCPSRKVGAFFGFDREMDRLMKEYK